MNSHRFKLYRAYSISFTSSNVDKCFWSWILMDCIKVQEKKRKLLSCVPVLDKTWIQAFSRCSRATTAKKCTKKAWCTCKVVVLLIKPIAFLPLSLPSASSLLKLPNVGLVGEGYGGSFQEKYSNDPFIFLLLQRHKHTLPEPKTKEKQKLPEINNYLQHIFRSFSNLIKKAQLFWHLRSRMPWLL